MCLCYYVLYCTILQQHDIFIVAQKLELTPPMCKLQSHIADFECESSEPAYWEAKNSARSQQQYVTNQLIVLDYDRFNLQHTVKMMVDMDITKVWIG